MIKKCLGCGIKLQSTDNQKLGFVPKHKKDADLCERCFKTPKRIATLILSSKNLDLINPESVIVVLGSIAI